MIRLTRIWIPRTRTSIIVLLISLFAGRPAEVRCTDNRVDTVDARVLLLQTQMPRTLPPPVSAPEPAFLPGTFTMAGVAGITGLAIYTDQSSYSILNRWRRHSSILSRISPNLTKLGDGVYTVVLFGGFLGAGLIDGNASTLNLGKLGLESYAVSGITVQLLKYLTGREQPDAATMPSGKWYGPLSYFRRNPARTRGVASFDAFPSGHTASVFAAATVLSDYYKDQPWVAYTSYTIASGVAVSRVMERQHWVSDCFVGGVIGILSSRLVSRLNASPSSVSLGPAVLRQSYGLRLALNL